MPRILVVDDSATMRQVITRCLGLCGVDPADVVQATNGAEGLDAAFETSPDLIISDVNMPLMSGSEMLASLRADDRFATVPVVMVTSVSQSRVLLELTRLGATRVVRKPFQPHELAELLTPFVAQASASAPTAADDGPVIDLVDHDDEQRWRDALDRTVPRLMERTAFAEVTARADLAPGDQLVVYARVPFTGVREGDVWLGSSLAVARDLGGVIRGEPIADTDDLSCADAMAELANILAGDLLEEANPGGDYSFGLPHVGAALPSDPDLRAATVYELDGGQRVYANVITGGPR